MAGIEQFFDTDTCTWTFIVYDKAAKVGALVQSVPDSDIRAPPPTPTHPAHGRHTGAGLGAPGSRL